MIEKVTRQKYDDYVRATVLEPCGITDMRIAANARAERAQGEVVYYAEGGADPYRQDVARTDSVGGWIATAGDLVRFATHIETVLKPATIVTMTTPSSTSQRRHFATGWSQFAKGWPISDGGNWWYNGTITGTSAILVRSKSCLSWAALANSRKNAPHQFDVRPGARRNDAGHGPRGESLGGLEGRAQLSFGLSAIGLLRHRVLSASSPKCA